jgi:hypothetical protein
VTGDGGIDADGEKNGSKDERERRGTEHQEEVIEHGVLRDRLTALMFGSVSQFRKAGSARFRSEKFHQNNLVISG